MLVSLCTTVLHIVGSRRRVSTVTYTETDVIAKWRKNRGRALRQTNTELVDSKLKLVTLLVKMGQDKSRPAAKQSDNPVQQERG